MDEKIEAIVQLAGCGCCSSDTLFKKLFPDLTHEENGYVYANDDAIEQAIRQLVGS